MTTKKAPFTLANYEIAIVNVTLLVLIYIYVRTILFVKIANQFADSNITPSLHLHSASQIFAAIMFVDDCGTKNPNQNSLSL